MFALALRRESLARLREDPRCALTILAAGDVAVTAIGRATVVEEHERVAVVESTSSASRTTATTRS